MKSSTFKISALALALGLSTGIAVAEISTYPELLTVEERAEFRSQMQAAQSLEERQALRDAMRSEVQERAEAAGIELPDNAPIGMRGEHPDLLTPEERAEFRSQMQAAQTMEERQALRETMRAKVQERATAAGIELPENGAMGMRGERPEHAGKGMRGERPDHGDMGMRGNRPDHADMGMRGDRPDRPDMGMHAERPDRSTMGNSGPRH